MYSSRRDTGVSLYRRTKKKRKLFTHFIQKPIGLLGDEIKVAYHQTFADMATPFAHPFYWGAWVLQGATEPMNLSVFN